jgi:predicted phosphate transport protein (TIGR00153 family)
MGFSLIPKNDKYFDDFDAAIGVVREVTQLLRAAVDGERLPKDLWRRIKVLEHKADEVVRRVHVRLDESFVTPIEREDIHLLIVTIDDVADTIAAAVSRLDVYEIEEPTEELRALVRALDEMVEQLVIAVHSLRTLEPVKVREATGKVDVLEEKIDDLFRDSLRKLFNRHPEAFELVRWKDVYDNLEAAADHGRHVARTVNHILVRHS